MKKIVLTTPYVSTNRLYSFHTGRRTLTKTARVTKEVIGWEAKAQCDDGPLEGELVVAIDLFMPDRRRRDLDNVKGLIDALTGVVWKDDSQIVDLHIRKFLASPKPRVEITCNPKK